VADAASLGGHWVYDLAKIEQAAAAAGGDPAFLPVLAQYHTARQAGDCTMYGETAMVVLRALAARKGWDRPDFAAKYIATFGPGGTYVGYADNVIKGTVYNMLAVQMETLSALTPPSGLADRAVVMAGWTQVKALAESGTLAPAALGDAAEAAARAANPAADAPAVAWIRSVAERIADATARPTGIDDKQSAGLAQLAPLVARYAGHKELTHVVNESVRSMQNSDDAVAWLVPMARIIEAVILGATPASAVSSNLVHFEQPYRGIVEAAAHAAATEADFKAVIARFGNTCELNSAVPGALYLALRHAGEGGAGYAAAVRENILAGGDSAGRAMLLGALLGAAAGGVPDEWLARLRCRDELAALTAGIHDDAHAASQTDHVAVHPAAAHGGAATSH
jgi:hypothetical protein